MNALVAPPHAVDPSTFRAAFRRLAGGVSIVTVGRGDTRTGLTATSIASFSADPAILTFTLAGASSTRPVLERERRFGVAVLAADQQAIAERFSGAGGIRGAARHDGAEWTTAVTGAPLLVGALVSLDCELEETIERHGQFLVFGRIRAVIADPDDARSPLLYARGAYRTLP
ncbi:MAG: flavin reductase [Phyllobacteriaceae bacterium]|nr:flavin reductase [Phyllobacteriaceae bacterium]